MSRMSAISVLSCVLLGACEGEPPALPSASHDPVVDPLVPDPPDPWGDTAPFDTAPTDASTTEEETLPMPGFSFVRPDLAGMPYPWDDEDLDFLAGEGIDLVVSLTQSALDEEAVAARGMELLHLPIEDFHPPTPEQQLAFVQAMQARRDAEQEVAVHCLAGLGRTGTMLATWFVVEGATAEEALAEIRLLRPGSVETVEQEDAVRRFARAMEER